MKQRLLSLFIGLALSLDTASAGVISRDWKTPGDGLLTYDDVNRREWLDLTESMLLQFPGSNFFARLQNAQAEFQSGEMFDGFTPANGFDVASLAQSAGIDMSTLDFVTNQAPSHSLVTLLGVTHVDASTVTSWGALLGGPGGREATPTALVTIHDTSKAGVEFLQVDRSDYGLWMYRQIPEPSTSFLMVAMTVILLVLHYRRREQPVA